MPMLQRPDGQIYYEEFGQGFPILLFAPGGLRSRLDMWHHPADGPRRNNRPSRRPTRTCTSR